MMNDAENWENLQALFHLVEMTPEQDRQRVLSEQCPDEALRHRVLEILRASSIESSTIPKERPVQRGRIGPYALIRHLGSGGLGSIYLVERMVGGTAQLAALKVLAAHAAGSSFIERFYREEDILASLNHPNITHMFDAGLTETGQPYLVMEYVDGIHLDVYCDEQKLAVAQRIELFLQVCNAVGYAHRNLVIHLDLKPSNILVTAEADVKLLDFGTSKIIQSDSLLTTTVLATPAYASPEQLRNEPVTTASDIYALGAVLFELLAGRRPGGKASVAIMIERALRDQPPEKLTLAVTPEAADLRGVSEKRLRQLLSGDLATIIAKCLSPRPEERYPSIDMLVEDLRRYLDGRPVLARPQTTLYRMSKFVRRNRRGVVVTIAACLLLLGVLGYAEVQQERALREGQRALRMQTFMYRMFKMANSAYTGKPTATVSDLLNLGVRMLPQYIKDPTDLREAQMSLAESMLENDDFDSARKVFTQTIVSAKSAGDINAEAESEAFAGEIAYIQGDVEDGADLTAHALALSQQRGVSPSVRVWSEMYYATNRDDVDVGQRTDENLRLLRSAVAEAQAYDLPTRETTDAIYTLADDLKGRGRISEAELLFQKLLVLLKQDPLTLCDQASVYLELAWIRDFDGNLNGSLEYYKQALGDYSQCSGTESQGYLLAQADQLGELTKAGRAQEGIEAMERSIPARRKLLKNGGQLLGALYVLATAYVDVGRYKDAETIANELIAMQAGRATAPFRPAGVAHLVMARALIGERRYRDALPHAQLAATLLNNGTTPSAKSNEALANKVLADVQEELAKGR
jgi:serine/threonine protein kinase/tetratricopeptide (TPR) repeat protein